MSYFQVILFIGNPGGHELSQLLSGFTEDSLVTLLQEERLEQATIQPLVEKMMPDLICVFADAFEAEGQAVLPFCQQVRDWGLQNRMVLVVQTDQPEAQRIQYLIQGADDILPGNISPEEFRVRLLVHLRRNLDFSVNEVTLLPGLQFAGKVVQRRLNQQQPVALLVIELNSLDVYSELYGELAARQVLKTFAALLSRLILMPDFISQTDENHFVIVTHPDKAEKIAALCSRQFDGVSPNFYSEKDRKQGYLIAVITNHISRRVPLMHLSIGIAATDARPFDSFMSLFNASQQMKSLAKMQPQSSWQSDRLRLAGSQVAYASPPRYRILVVESDAALAYLLKTTLEMEGYAVELSSNTQDAQMLLRQSAGEDYFKLIILDALVSEIEDEMANGLRLAQEIREQFPDVLIICASSVHNRQKVLQAGIDLYLPKPFELSSLFAWIHRLIEERTYG